MLANEFVYRIAYIVSREEQIKSKKVKGEGRLALALFGGLKPTLHYCVALGWQTVQPASSAEVAFWNFIRDLDTSIFQAGQLEPSGSD